VAEDLSWSVILDRWQGPGKAVLLLETCVFGGSVRPLFGSVINPDSGAPLIVNDERVLATEFEKMRRSEILGSNDGDRGKDRRTIYSPLWQADGKRIRRFAPSNSSAVTSLTFCITSLCV